MLENRIPLFEQGRILKKEALELLRDYPLEMAELTYAEYSDGIISGFLLRCQDGTVCVGKGILKHEGVLYFLTEEQSFLIPAFGEDCILRVYVQERKKTDDYYSNQFSADLRIREGTEERQAYELGRFRLEKGAQLRLWDEYLDFKDASTPINTLNLHWRPQAGIGGQTLSPILTGLYAKELLALGELTPLDAAFCIACLNGKAASEDMIVQYLAAGGVKIPQDAGPAELYSGLLHLLGEHRQNAGQMSGYRTGKSRRTVIE